MKNAFELFPSAKVFNLRVEVNAAIVATTLDTTYKRTKKVGKLLPSRRTTNNFIHLLK
jgi:hypothetical protein